MNKQLTLRKSVVVGFSVMALSMLAFSAHALPIVKNGSFENPTTTGGSFLVGVSVPGWGTTSVYSVLVTPSNVSSWLWTNSSPGGLKSISAKDGNNFLAADGSFGLGTLYQQLTGLTIGQTYKLSFSQAAGQLIGFDGDTLEQWVVTIGGTLGTIPKNVTLPSTSAIAGGTLTSIIVENPDYQWTTPLMQNPSHDFIDWQLQSFTFQALHVNELLGFLAVGAPIGPPPMVLLDGVSITTVPEPETLALLGIGLLGILAARRQQKKHA